MLCLYVLLLQRNAVPSSLSIEGPSQIHLSSTCLPQAGCFKYVTHTLQTVPCSTSIFKHLAVRVKFTFLRLVFPTLDASIVTHTLQSVPCSTSIFKHLAVQRVKFTFFDLSSPHWMLQLLHTRYKLYHAVPQSLSI